MDESGPAAAAIGAAGTAEATSTQRAPALRPDRIPVPVWVIAAVFVALELVLSGRYGFMQDELYFVEAGRHLAFGYVDQPPLMPLVDRIMDLLFGVTPTAVRVVPALAGGAVVVLAAGFAALFGAGRLGRVAAALLTACSATLLSADHLGNTTPLDLLTWPAVALCVAVALLRDRPRWWLGGGVAAGIGLENDNLMLLLLICLALGILASEHRPVLRTPWPWLGAAIAAVLWAPNVVWQAAHGWPQLTMASALHRQNSSVADYISGLPVQLLSLGGLLAFPLAVAGFVVLWRRPQLRFLAVATTLIVVYVVAWVPGKSYYSFGMAPALLAAGAVAAEGWIARARRPRLRTAVVVAAPLVGCLVLMPLDLPLVPVTDVHSLPSSSQRLSNVGDTVGWPQFASAVAAQDAALAQAGQPPTSIFTGAYGEAGALDALGSGYRLPPVLSGHNAYWMWGPGQASDQTVLVVDALGQLKPYFANCRLLASFNPPYGVQNDWTDLQIGVCTGPVAGWNAIWPHLKHYD
ncbi:MAG TPA: glycosyltransferase family 39 protein [Actinocrinis sp.]